MGMATNFEVRLLLVLWDLGGLNVPQGKLCDRFSGKGSQLKKAYKIFILWRSRAFNSFLTLILQSSYVHLSVQLNAI